MTFFPNPVLSDQTTTQRTLADRFADLHNVKDFGAQGDGVTNDTVAIQAAINSVTGTLFFPRGSYLIDGVTLKPGVMLQGDGVHSTTILANQDDITLFAYVADTSLKVGFAVQHMRFSNNFHRGCTAISLDGDTSAVRISQIRLNDITIEGLNAASVSVVDDVTNTLTTSLPHNLVTGAGVRFITSGSMPGGVQSVPETYWVNVQNATQVTLHDTRADALANTNVVNISSTGSGTLTILSDGFNFGVVIRFGVNTYMSNLFVSAVTDGVYLDNCADTDIVSCKVQSGTGYGFVVLGGVGAFDEGVRLTACSTNGQEYGLAITGQDWGDVSACSFTTAPGGALMVANATNWKFAASEFATAGLTPQAAAVNLDGATSGFAFAACQFSNSTVGVILRGSKHMISGSYFTANTNVDVSLDGATGVGACTSCVISGNVLASSGVAQSVNETETAPGSNSADYNCITGNVCEGTILTVGDNTVVANNVLY